MQSTNVGSEREPDGIKKKMKLYISTVYILNISLRSFYHNQDTESFIINVYITRNI